MRDKRLIAVHRGGLLAPADHRLLASWAADCAERALRFLSCEISNGPNAQELPLECQPFAQPVIYAIDMARSWASGQVKAGVAMQAAVAAHACARSLKQPASIAAARAAGHAAATAHLADHSLGALLYALKAMHAVGEEIQAEQDFRLAELPLHLRPSITSGILARRALVGKRET